MPAGGEQRSPAVVLNADRSPKGLRIEAQPALAKPGNPTVVPKRWVLTGYRPTYVRVPGRYPGIDAVRAAVTGSDQACRKHAAAPACARSRPCGSSARSSPTAAPACRWATTT